MYALNIDLHHQNGSYSKESGVNEVQKAPHQVLCVGVYVEENGGTRQATGGLQEIDVSEERTCYDDNGNNIVLRLCGFSNSVF